MTGLAVFFVVLMAALPAQLQAATLPPLNALRAFEAAARHLSFTDAAAELHVTQAAVSHHVKALEERLGLKLFRRVGRPRSEEAWIYIAMIRIMLRRLAQNSS